MTKSLCISVFMFAVLLSRTVQSADRPHSISLDQAKRLVAAGLPTETRHLPKFGVDGGLAEDFPRFYVLNVTWAGDPNGSVEIGFYSVDKMTGDVWDAVAECDKIDTANLRAMQARIRRQIGLSDSQYHKLTKKEEGPFCAGSMCSCAGVPCPAGAIAIAQTSHPRKGNETEVQAGSPTWTDPQTGLMWAKKDNGCDVNWNQANNYCANLRLGGYSNWRLPSTDELAAIVDHTQNRNGWQVKGGIRPTGVYWSTTEEKVSVPARYFDVFSFYAPTPGVFASAQPDNSDNTRALCVRRSGK
jgi:uncharacterized protein DUF1566